MKKKIKKVLKHELTPIIFGAIFYIVALILEHAGQDVASLVFYLIAMLGAGHKVFFDAIKGIIRGDFMDEKFLMTLAAVGAMIIGERGEGVAVMLFFLVGEFFEHKAVKRSRNSIKSLMDICPDTAIVVDEDGTEHEEFAEDVEIGTTIVIRSGERVPIDAMILEGDAELDTSALTGEATPTYVKVGDTVDSGVVVIGGVLKCKTLRTSEDSSASRILELVENATERKSKEEQFITKFSRVYTPTVIALAILMAFIPPLFNLIAWKDSIYRALSFLVVSCPCALVISVPLAFFGGIGGAASKGILYKGGNTFSAISKVKTVVFDKTGTLTTGNFRIVDVENYDIDKDYLLTLTASCEYGSTHPIGKCLKQAKTPMPISDFEEIRGKGVIATVDGKRVAVGNPTLMSDEGIAVVSDGNKGKIFVSVDGKLSGIITVADDIKKEAKNALKNLKSMGVEKTVILSGDSEISVKYVAEELEIDEYRHGLLPKDKFDILEKLIEEKRGSTIYVGDGINDAPCLARADVGIAMGSMGSDSAIDAADAVIMSDNLDRIPDTIRIANKTLTISKENIVFALGVKILIIILVALNFANMWIAVFGDVGVAVIAILNSMRTLLFGRKKDKKKKTNK